MFPDSMQSSVLSERVAGGANFVAEVAEVARVVHVLGLHVDQHLVLLWALQGTVL